MRNITRLFMALALVAVIAVTVFANAKTADAGGMGGVSVSVVTVCKNGLHFTGTDTDPAAIMRVMTAKIFRGHVGVPVNLVAVGNSTFFTAVGQIKGFTIYYPSNSFMVGDPITYSVLTSDGSGYGGGQFGYVSDCYLRHRWF